MSSLRPTPSSPLARPGQDPPARAGRPSPRACLAAGLLVGALPLAGCGPAAAPDAAAPSPSTASAIQRGNPATPGGGAPGVGAGGSSAGTVDRLPGGVRLLPLGDSITVGLGGPGGYRLPLWSRLQHAGVATDFVGTQLEGSPPFFVDPEHEGHVGWRVSDLIQFDGGGLEPDSSIELVLAATAPEQILLHAGTNDLLAYVDWHQAPKFMGQLLDRIWSFDPTIAVLVATVVPTADPSTNLGVDWYRRRLAQLVAAKAAEGRRVRLVDMGGQLEVADLGLIDAVHPGPSGYQAMADLWFEALTQPAQGPPMIDPIPPPPPFATALASSFAEGYLPSLAVNGAGLDGDLHDDEEPGVPLGWRSAPFEQLVGADGIGVATEPGPVFVVRLPGPADVECLQLWNGRNRTDDGVIWFNLESIRSVAVETQDATGAWTDRGELTFTRGMARARAPYELIEVDWPGTRAIRLRVLSTYGSLGGNVGPLVDGVSISELRVLGAPTAAGGR